MDWIAIIAFVTLILVIILQHKEKKDLYRMLRGEPIGDAAPHNGNIKIVNPSEKAIKAWRDKHG